jgi:HlyD family secretion protein
LGLLLAAGCGRTVPPAWQGYLEGDYVYISSPIAGRLDALAVAKGERVAADATLFRLERDAELAAQREAAGELQAARERWADLQKGSRPSELAALNARRQAAQATAELARIDLSRAEALFKQNAIAASELDHARLTYEADLNDFRSADSDLATAGLGGRTDAVAAAQAEVRAAEAAQARADWSVRQKEQAAPRAALVADTLYRPGEFVAAGSPIVVLLPPENLKVRFFVSETDLGALRLGDAVQVALSGVPQPLRAHISYLAAEPEYTPPVLYNRDNRAKLVFMVEAVFDPATARDLHPGQPADVRLVP